MVAVIEMATSRFTSGIVLTTVVLVIAFGAGPALMPVAGYDGVPTRQQPADLQSGYNVTFNSATISELVLRNVTVENAEIRNVTVDELTVGNETQEDVKLENVTLSKLQIEQGTVQNVETGTLSIRNRSVLNVPGGELLGNVGDRSLERHVLDNLTVTGVVIGELHIESLTVESEFDSQEATIDDDSSEQPEEKPDVSLEQADVANATIGNASFESGAVENASVDDETVDPDSADDTEDDDAIVLVG